MTFIIGRTYAEAALAASELGLVDWGYIWDRGSGIRLAGRAEIVRIIATSTDWSDSLRGRINESDIVVEEYAL